MNVLYKTLLFLFLLTTRLAAQDTPPFFPEEMIVTASSLNLRDAPDKNAKKVGTLTQGTVVQFLETYK
ncbi:MAG: SH3 domain-containing protein, partial [Saprospiraceae bacterium]|nr:SH3 domain-containing protein [Saprospiraceae bacterium]